MNAQTSFNFDPPRGPFAEEFHAYLKTETGNRAWQFDQANPHVYKLFCTYAKQVLDKGIQNFGVAAIWERLRWDSAFSTTGEPFKLANSHRAYYARRLMAEQKAFEGFFNIQRVSI